MKLRFVRLPRLHIFDQLQLEELFLRSTDTSWCMINRGPLQPVIVTGLSGKVNELVDVERAKRDGIRVIRRYSGGGTVVVDENTLFVTLIMNANELKIDPYPRNIMKWSGELYENVFSTPTSMFELRENDYILGNLKFGGNAQNISRHRFVHHTSFLWDFNPHNMSYLQIPQKMPEYRQRRDHTSFLTTLKTHFPSLPALEDSILTHMKSRYEVDELSLDRLKDEQDQALGDRSLETICRTKYVELNDTT